MGTRKKLGSPWIRPRSLFSKILMSFCSDEPCEMFRPNLKSVASPGPEIIVIIVLGGVASFRTSNLGEEQAVDGRGWYR